MSTNLEKAAISKLRTWEKEQAAEVRRLEEALIAQLRAAVPNDLNVWLQDNGTTLLTNLLAYGAVNLNYSKYQDGFWGYTNLKEFEQEGLKRLMAAWEGVVNIVTDWHGVDKLEVHFTAV